MLWSWGAGLKSFRGALELGGHITLEGAVVRGQGSWLRGALVFPSNSSGALCSLQAGGGGGAGGPLFSLGWGVGLANLNPEHPWVPRTLTFLAFLPPAGAIFLVSQTAPNTDEDGRDDRALPPAKPGALAGFFIPVAPGVGFPSLCAVQQRSWAGNTPTSPLSLPVAAWELVLGVGDRNCSPKWGKLSRTKIRKI